MKLGDTLVKYWAVISALAFIILTGLVWGIRLETKTNANTAYIDGHDDDLTDLDKRVAVLEKIEDLREKGQLK